MTIQSPYLPRANVPFLDDTGHVSRPWYLYLQNMFNLVDPSGNVNANDLAVQVAFDNDNTSQVADLQNQIDRLDGAGQDPFTDGNADVTAVAGRVSAIETQNALGVGNAEVAALAVALGSVQVGMDFIPSSPAPFQEIPDLPARPSQVGYGPATLQAFSAAHG